MLNLAHPLPWRPIALAPKDGFGILAYGVHDRDAPPGASRQVKAGDHWWAIIQWDIWRAERKWVFCKDGSDVWSEPIAFCVLTPPEEGSLA